VVMYSGLVVLCMVPKFCYCLLDFIKWRCVPPSGAVRGLVFGSRVPENRVYCNCGSYQVYSDVG